MNTPSFYKKIAHKRKENYSLNKDFFEARLDIKHSFTNSLDDFDYQGKDWKDSFITRLQYSDYLQIMDLSILKNYQLSDIRCNPNLFETMTKELLKYKLNTNNTNHLKHTNMEFGRPISSELSKSLLNVLTPSDRNDIADELNVNPLTLHAILKRERNVSKMYHDAILHSIETALKKAPGMIARINKNWDTIKKYQL